MFSEELYMLDRNTSQFMLDEYGRMDEERKALVKEQEVHPFVDILPISYN